jgi:hypothetical protein
MAGLHLFRHPNGWSLECEGCGAPLVSGLDQEDADRILALLVPPISTVDDLEAVAMAERAHYGVAELHGAGEEEW